MLSEEVRVIDTDDYLYTICDEREQEYVEYEELNENNG